MPLALTPNRPAARPPLPVWSAAQPERPAQAEIGDWFASSLELRRGLFVLDLCADAPAVDWQDLFAGR